MFGQSLSLPSFAATVRTAVASSGQLVSAGGSGAGAAGGAAAAAGAGAGAVAAGCCGAVWVVDWARPTATLNAVTTRLPASTEALLIIGLLRLRTRRTNKV